MLSGVLRGAGRQGIGAATSWCSYWLIGLPLAYVLAFRAQMGVLGLRLSLAAAVAMQALVLHVYTACMIDFDEEVRRAQALVAVEPAAANGGGGGDDDLEECGVERGLFGSGSGLLVPAVQDGSADSITGGVSSLKRPLLANEAA